MKQSVQAVLNREHKTIPALILGGASLALVLYAGLPAMANNTSTQEGSTAAATTIEVVGKVADTNVTTITFPEGAPSSSVSNPYNNVDTVSDAQLLDAAASEPVVRLRNTAGVNYNVSLAITDWTNGVAASEDYAMVAPATTTVSSVTDVLSSDGLANQVDTAQTLNASEYFALYLELNLSSLVGVSGTSTLTVLGETP